MLKASTLIFLLVGLVGLFMAGKGILLALSASRLSSDGLTAQAEVLRVDERQKFAHKDQDDYWRSFYTEVVRFTAWNGETVEARLPEKNADEPRARPGDILTILYHPDRPTEAVPVSANPWPMQAVLLIVLGLSAVTGAVFLAWRKGVF